MIPEIKEADKLINEIDKNNVERIESLYTQLTGTTSKVKDITIQSTPKIHSREDALLLLAEMTKDYSEANDKLRKLYHSIEDRDLKIYIEKNYLMNGYSAQERNRILEVKWGIGKNRINKICRKIEKKHKSTH